MNDAAGKGKNIYTLPAGVPFVENLAAAIMAGQLPLPGGTAPARADLTRWTILLPTRRAARALSAAFYQLADGMAQLLPRIQPLGDIDDDELAFAEFSDNADGFEIPPAITAMERRFVLFHEITDWQEKHSQTPLAQLLRQNPQHALDIARTLASLVDGFETSNVDISIIPDLFEGEFAGHREQILQFLSIVQLALPDKIAAMGKMSPSERRNQLIGSYQAFLEAGNARGPVIAAGSTGSIPATARLLSCIAGLENGAVILPGLDTQMDDVSWQVLPQHHPQYAMYELLDKMNVARTDVRQLAVTDRSPLNRARNWLVSEIMRPAETTDQWRRALNENTDTMTTAIKGVSLLSADDAAHEARVIALVMRRALYDNQSAALVTPDRALARGVRNELERWGIDVDDSAGVPLKMTNQAIFLRLLLDTAANSFSPLTLKSLLAHTMSSFGLEKQRYRRLTWLLEMCVLRMRAPYRNLDGLLALARGAAAAMADDKFLPAALQQLDDKDFADLEMFATVLVERLAPLEQLFKHSEPCSLEQLVQTHLTLAEQISSDADDSTTLWQADSGGALSEFFSSILAAKGLAPEMTASAYRAFLDDHLGDVTVRNKAPASRQLSILGLLEARLVSTDITILGGLNETVWPAAAETDPWLNRNQLKVAGLALPEQRVGLSAHDFVQGFCTDTVFLTYSKKLGNAPAVPSRWLLRFQAMLKSCEIELNPSEPWLLWARKLDAPDRFAPVSRPAPAPPLSLRPKRFSVTGIDRLRDNPYAFYADKILALKPLNDLEEDIGALERGELVHHGLEQFVKRFPKDLPADANAQLLKCLEQALDKFASDPAMKILWHPQLVRMANWFGDYEKTLRQNQSSAKLEAEGKISFTIGDEYYTLTARADRIDVLNDQTYRLIDYKTGAAKSFLQTAKEFSAQLLLEASIAAQGGFKGLPGAAASQLLYIKLSGGVPAGEVKQAPEKNLQKAVAEALAGMKDLVAAYADPKQVYLAGDGSDAKSWESDYEHLSRWREWSHLGGAGGGDE